MHGLAVLVESLGMPNMRESGPVVLAGLFPGGENPGGRRCFCLRFWGAVRTCTWLSVELAALQPARTYI